MIFTLKPEYRNCPSCGRKVSFYGSDLVTNALNQIHDTPLEHCECCGVPFPVEQTKLIRSVMAQCNARHEQQIARTHILYSTFYAAYGAYNHVYAIPLFSIEELLTAENLMHNHYGNDQPQKWAASFRYSDQQDHGKMSLLSWQPLLWDAQRELFLAGADEGPRTVMRTAYE
jgi:hypothetical protein